MENVEIPPQTPQIKFIYSIHSLANFENVWAEATKSDIVLMEAVGLDESQRKNSEDLINWAAKNPSDTVKKNSLWYLSNTDGSIDFAQKVIEKVVLEGKNFHYVDEARNGDGIKAMDNGRAKYNQSVDLFYSGNLIEAYEKYREFCLSYAEGMKIRNELVANQITSLYQKNKYEWGGKKLVVIQGETHRQTYHMLKQRLEDASLSRTFLKERPQFDILSEIESRVIHHIDLEIDNMIKRGYLALYIIPRKTEYQPVGIEDIDQADKVVRLLTNDEVNKYIEKIIVLDKFLQDKKSDGFVGDYVIKQCEIMGLEILEKHPL